MKNIIGKIGDFLSRKYGSYIRWDSVLRVMIAYQLMEKEQNHVDIPASIAKELEIPDGSYLYGLRVNIK